MRKEQDLVLGIDTSNYKTSVAAVNSKGEILCDLRQLLRVKQGERGLRQSDALFQHIENLPDLLEKALAQAGPDKIGAVACSDKPRPVEGSYMPVFKAGIGFGQTVAAALGIPFYRFSHQEGHIEAIKAYSRFSRDWEEEPFLCYHLSGGTSELLVAEGSKIKLLGGTKDLSFGQVLDRVGVKLGMAFPAGEEMDRIALAARQASGELKRIPYDGLFFNLSGLETQCGRKAEERLKENRETDSLVRELFDRILSALIDITEKGAKETGIYRILFSGGVSSSRYISRGLNQHFEDTPFSLEFGNQELSRDNAVGIALLGGRRLWQSSL